MKPQLTILYISQTFPPEPGPTLRPLRQAVHLQRLGHVVTIVTKLPKAPLGRVFEGYRRKLWMRETVEGVDVVRVASLAVPNRGFLLRTLGCLSFCLVATFCGSLLRRRDLVVASVPNIATEMAALLIARVKRARFLLEMRDLIPEALALVGTPRDPVLYRTLERYFNAMYAWADFVIVPGTAMASHLRAVGVPDDKILILPHADDDDAAPEGPADSPSPGPTGDFVALYSGSFSAYYDLETMVAAARIREKEELDIRLWLMGTGRKLPAIQSLLRERPCRCVSLLEPVPPERVSDQLRYADVTLAPRVYFGEHRFLDGYLNAKAVEYLFAGKPIIAAERRPILASLLEEIGAGVTVSVRLQAEPGHVTQCPGQVPLVRGAMGMGAVFDHQELVLFCDGQDLVHVADVPVLMRNGDCPRTRRKQLPDSVWVDVSGRRFELAKYRD